MPRKTIEFLGSALRDLQAFPKSARRKAGFQLERLQLGLDPNDWKPMRSIGSGVCEIRIRDDDGAYRVIYIAKLETAIYVLHCFKKTSQKTSSRDIDLAGRRLRMLQSGGDR